eukprot:TRINITY_DN41762_c0_g1_i1.p1 TRINITY_DN41762_c0_g1~~TRINITY_DN41762_c0_g1_i1.p1  ORF type:complete len:231 (-),score=29.66 TRINITY_DN41762_c0_g1_i1:102-794(-)
MASVHLAADEESGEENSSHGEVTQSATREIWLLHTYQSFLATVLYFAITWLRMLCKPMWMKLFAQLTWLPLFMLLYHVLSRNRAGGYYNTFCEQFTKLPQHFSDLINRRVGFTLTAEFLEKIEQERQHGVVRAANAIESGVVFLFFVSLPSWLLAFTASSFAERGTGEDWYCSLVWMSVETMVYFALHCLVQVEKYTTDVLRPEGMWRIVVNDEQRTELEPFTHHPVPSY